MKTTAPLITGRRGKIPAGQVGRAFHAHEPSVRAGQIDQMVGADAPDGTEMCREVSLGLDQLRVEIQA